jgi:hypothetical protein
MNIRKMVCCIAIPSGMVRSVENGISLAALHPAKDASLQDAGFQGCIYFLPSDAILTDCVYSALCGYSFK